MKKLLQQIIFCFLLGCVMAGLAGCATDDAQNTSSRPWNSSEGWEGGFPSSLNQGR